MDSTGAGPGAGSGVDVNLAVWTRIASALALAAGSLLGPGADAISCGISLGTARLLSRRGGFSVGGIAAALSISFDLSGWAAATCEGTGAGTFGRTSIIKRYRSSFFEA